VAQRLGWLETVVEWQCPPASAVRNRGANLQPAFAQCVADQNQLRSSETPLIQQRAECGVLIGNRFDVATMVATVSRVIA
jgi:hypothetical protein